MRAPVLTRPCTASWEAMDGDDLRRHCRQCDKTVHNLSALAPCEAEALLAGPAPCVRFRVRRDGSVVFDLARAAALAAAVAAGSGSARAGEPVAPDGPSATAAETVAVHAAESAAGAPVRLLVVDDSGLSIPGVRIELLGIGPRRRAPDVVLATYYTDDEGRLEIAAPDRAAVRFRATKPGFEPVVDGLVGTLTVTLPLLDANITLGGI